MPDEYLPRKFREVEDRGEKGLFVYAALDTDEEARSILQATVLRARAAGIGAPGDAVDIVAAKIDEAEDTALTQWMMHWGDSPPQWFRQEAIAVMILLLHPIQRPLSRMPIDPFTHPGVDPYDHDRIAARKILNAAFKAHLDAYLGETYADLERRKRVFRHYIWTARFQFQAESALTIANASKVTRRSVEEAIEKTLRAIDVPPREKISPPGRPPRKTQVDG